MTKSHDQVSQHKRSLKSSQLEFSTAISYRSLRFQTQANQQTLRMSWNARTGCEDGMTNVRNESEREVRMWGQNTRTGCQMFVMSLNARTIKTCQWYTVHQPAPRLRTSVHTFISVCFSILHYPLFTLNASLTSSRLFLSSSFSALSHSILPHFFSFFCHIYSFFFSFASFLVSLDKRQSRYKHKRVEKERKKETGNSQPSVLLYMGWKGKGQGHP